MRRLQRLPSMPRLRRLPMRRCLRRLLLVVGSLSPVLGRNAFRIR